MQESLQTLFNNMITYWGFASSVAILGYGGLRLHLSLATRQFANAMISGGAFGVGLGSVLIWTIDRPILNLPLVDIISLASVSAIAGIIAFESASYVVGAVIGFFSRRGTRQLSQELAAKQAADRAKDGAS